MKRRTSRWIPCSRHFATRGSLKAKRWWRIRPREKSPLKDGSSSPGHEGVKVDLRTRRNERRISQDRRDDGETAQAHLVERRQGDDLRLRLVGDPLDVLLDVSNSPVRHLNQNRSERGGGGGHQGQSSSSARFAPSSVRISLLCRRTHSNTPQPSLLLPLLHRPPAVLPKFGSSNRAVHEVEIDQPSRSVVE